MRVNVYAEELTDRIQVVEKTINGKRFIGVRFNLELPAQHGQMITRGPFKDGPEDRSSAVTFWGKDAQSLMNILADAWEEVCEKSQPAPSDPTDPRL